MITPADSEKNATPKPLKLLAFSAEDFRILSGLLQDSILALENASWQKKAKRFTIPLSRFCWEVVRQNENKLFRVASCLVIDGVVRAQYRGLQNLQKKSQQKNAQQEKTKSSSAKIVELLACEFLHHDSIRFTFSGGSELCLFNSEAGAQVPSGATTDNNEAENNEDKKSANYTPSHQPLRARLTDVGEPHEAQSIPQHDL